MLLQGQLTAAQPLLSGSEKVLVAGQELGAPAASLPRTVAFFAEKLPSLGELVKRLSGQTEFLYLVPAFWIQGSKKMTVDIGLETRQELMADAALTLQCWGPGWLLARAHVRAHKPISAVSFYEFSPESGLIPSLASLHSCLRACEELPRLWMLWFKC